MNKYIITAQVLELFRVKKTNFFLLLLYVPNNIKNKSFFQILTCVENNLISSMFQWYKVNDICTIEGILYNINYFDNSYQLFIDIEMIALNI